MANEQMSFADESAEYAAFVEKFKPKKTTDSSRHAVDALTA